MKNVRGCELPDGLLYHIEHNVWVRQEDSDIVTMGMTAYGAALSGKIVAFTPKKAGKTVKKNKSCATIESGKWVGPAKAPVSGKVVEVNEALLHQPELINNDPYGVGWLVKIEPSNWQGDATDLLTGQAAFDAFEQKMELEGFEGCY